MKHTGSKIITLIFLSIIAIIGVFIIQFKSGKTFSLNLGAISVSGRYDISNGKNEPQLPIQILANGISFYVSERSPIIANSPKGEIKLKVTEYSNNDKSFTIHCGQDTAICFAYDKFGDIEVLNISAELPEEFSGISIPWTIAGNARFEIKDNKSLISYNKKNFIFEGDFGFNELGIVDTALEEPRLKLSKTENIATYKNYIETKDFSLENIASMPGSSELEYTVAKEKFNAQALNILSEQVKRKTYSEESLVAYIAEMARRNMYLNALEKAPARLLAKKNRSELSLAFYGNIIELYENVLQKEGAERQNLSKLISERSLDIFNFENLIAFLVERNSAILISDLPAILEQNDLSSLSLCQSIGIIECALDYAEYFPQRENFFEKSLETCFRKITNSLFVLNESLYALQVTNERSFVDTELSLRLVRLLLRIKNTSSWKAVAYKLYTSILDLLGVDGSLVKTYVLEGKNEKQGLLVDDTVIFTLAQVYPMLSENNWYPSAKSLVKSEAGIWIYGSAKNIKVLESRAAYLKLAIEGEKDTSEYFVLRNVPSLKNIIIHGLDYRSDPRFETYNSSGYVYNARTETLYLKLRHKKDVEEIVLEMQ